MPLNPNIILQAGNYPKTDPVRQYGNVLQIQNLQRQNQLADRDMARDEALRTALQGAVNPETGEVDQNAIGRAYIDSGDAQGYLQHQKGVASQRKAALDAETAELNQAKLRTTMIVNAMGTAKDQQSYDRAKQFLQGQGIDVGQFPPTFDPEGVKQLSGYLMTQKDRLDQEWKAKNYDLSARRTRASETTAQAAAAGKLGSNTRVIMKGEEEESKKVGGYFGDMYIDINNAATEGNKRIANLTQLDRLLDNLKTGKFTGTKVEFSKMLSGIGIDPASMSWLSSLPDGAQVASAEASEALSNEMALQLRNPAGGAGMPGAMSDKDREFLTSMVPGLGTTKQGRKTMVEFQRRLNSRNNEVARMAREYRKKNGRLDENFQDMVAQKFQNEDLFGDYHTTGENLPKVRGPAELEAIPPGGFFVGPDGVTRQKL